MAGRPRKDKPPVRAERLKEIRLELGMSQTQFGEKIGLTQKAVSKMETNVRGIDDDVIEAVVKAFPEKRYESAYLKGTSDLKTHTDVIAWIIDMSDRKLAEHISAFEKLAELIGFSFEPRPVGNGSGYIVRIGEAEAMADGDKFESIVNEAEEFIQFKLLKLFAD